MKINFRKATIENISPIKKLCVETIRNSCTKEYLPEQLGGWICSVIDREWSDTNGPSGAEFLPIYAAAKAGVISMTESAALEHSKLNISINAIVPGPFETPMLDEALNNQAGGNKEKQNVIEERYKQMIPKGRFGRPDEFAEAILWLCQGESTYLSGHSLIIDGGMTSRFR